MRKGERLRRAHDALAVEGEVAKRHRLAAGREQHPLALDHLLATLAPDAHPVRALELGGPGEARHLVLLEQRGDPLREPADDAVLPAHHGRQVELDAARLDAVHREPLQGVAVELARVEERLRRDAADVEARAAEGAILLDARDLHAELGGTDGGHVASGTRPDYDEVEATHHISSSRRAGSSSRSFTRTRKVTACSPSTMR